jgi:hypothetical protein
MEILLVDFAKAISPRSGAVLNIRSDTRFRCPQFIFESAFSWSALRQRHSTS